MNRCEAVEYANIIKTIVGLTEVEIILNTFVSAFVSKSVMKTDGCRYLHGNFNLGGTISGRLSSSKVNLQNLPSTGSTYSKLIKNCFIAPRGWVLVGADFSSLEDKISALTTKDPNKLKVYTDGYDGHCLRAYAYFGKDMPGISDTVIGINSISTLFPKLRQKSKAPTFLLTYGGTYFGLMNLGFTKEEAKAMAMNYHNLYEVADAWVKDRIDKASKIGYATIAFGLRLNTPILDQVVLNTNSTPYEAYSEARSMGNALGQSYGMLNNRAAIEFHNRLMKSDFKYDVKPISHIHDSQYFIVREDVKIIKWVNDNLIDCMEWQDLPELESTQVKLGGELSIFWPTWADETKIPNNASEDDIRDLF